MIEPTKAPPKKTTPNKVEAKDPKSNRPTKGEEIQKGSSIAENKAPRARGSACRLAAAATGGYLEVANFCCPEYLATMRTLIKSNWNSQQGAVGCTHLRFVIQTGRPHRRHHGRAVERCRRRWICSRAVR